MTFSGFRSRKMIPASCSEIWGDMGEMWEDDAGLVLAGSVVGRVEEDHGASWALGRPEAGGGGRAEPPRGGGGAPGGAGAAWAFGRSREAEGAPSSGGAEAI